MEAPRGSEHRGWSCLASALPTGRQRARSSESPQDPSLGLPSAPHTEAPPQRRAPGPAPSSLVKVHSEAPIKSFSFIRVICFLFNLSIFSRKWLMPLKFETQTQSLQDPAQSDANAGTRQPQRHQPRGCGARRAPAAEPGRGLGQGCCLPLHLLGETCKEEPGRRFGTGGDHHAEVPTPPRTAPAPWKGRTRRHRPLPALPGGSPHPAPAQTNTPPPPASRLQSIKSLGLNKTRCQ